MLALSGLLILPALAPTGPAAAAVTCAFNPIAGRVDVAQDTPGETGTLLRGPGGTILVNGQQCKSPTGAGATVYNVDLINVLPGPRKDQFFTIDLAGGPFRPGRTNEADGSHEIEMTLDFGASADDDALTIRGGSNPESLATGVVGGRQAIDLDVGGGGRDYEVTLTNVEKLEMFTGGGADQISVRGLLLALDTIDPGPGADQVVIGSRAPFRTGGTLAGILTGLTVKKATGDRVFVDDSARRSAKVITITDQGVFGLSPGSVNFVLGAPSVTVNGGSGGNTFKLSSTLPAAETTLNTGTGADTVTVAGAALGADGVVRVFGLAGNDSLTVATAHPISTSILMYGGLGADTLRGNAGREHLNGGAGDDSLAGGAGNDVLSGGTGADLLEGELGNDVLVGEDGDDQLSGGEGRDSLSGGNGLDLLIGGHGEDLLIGQAGADRLFGGGSNDRLYGGAQYDVLNGGIAHDFCDVGVHGGRMILCP